ncbi:hypothetical protein [Thiomonas bhubaneswarensis]|uniref:Small secreted protein n=1 Tax=Thiomonas bhubaneswarensis TaxID=339866 RepID=A0A0K6HWL5_9BURK|nr:hypothetical protein [Thiomonas bhubaneswarensis]CUA95309.1 hypothetical protein Ga0061069_10331 [Thiomonas bhubaneswarensis]
MSASRRRTYTLAALLALSLAGGLSGCQKPEGPAEKAGKAIDNAAAQAGQQVQKAGEKIQDTAKGDN